jgi:hypothetical protein
MSLGKDAQRVLDAWYDFALCRRPDSSIYGIADGAQCRKGTPTNADDEAVTRDKVVGELKSLAGKAKGKALSTKEMASIDQAFAKLTDDELSNIANTSVATLSEGLRRSEAEEEISRFPRMMSWDEVEALDKNRERLLKGFDDPSTLTANLRKVRDEEVDAFLLIAGKGFDKGEGLGGKGGKERVGLNEEGTHSSKVTDWRKRMIARRFLEQEGKDLYTGLPLAKVDAALEHIRPYSSGYQQAEQVSNWGWISRVVNDKKEGTSMQEFYERHVDPSLKQGKENYSREYEEKVGRQKEAWRISRRNIAENRELAERLAHAYRDKPNEVLARLYHKNKLDKVKYGVPHSGAPYFAAAPLSNGENYGTTIIRNWGRLDDSGRSRLTAFSNQLAKENVAMREAGVSNKDNLATIGRMAEEFFRTEKYEL